jgi:hypothetical protein
MDLLVFWFAIEHCHALTLQGEQGNGLLEFVRCGLDSFIHSIIFFFQ